MQDKKIDLKIQNKNVSEMKYYFGNTHVGESHERQIYLASVSMKLLESL